MRHRLNSIIIPPVNTVKFHFLVQILHIGIILTTKLKNK